MKWGGVSLISEGVQCGIRMSGNHKFLCKVLRDVSQRQKVSLWKKTTGTVGPCMPIILSSWLSEHSRQGMPRKAKGEKVADRQKAICRHWWTMATFRWELLNMERFFLCVLLFAQTSETLLARPVDGVLTNHRRRPELKQTLMFYRPEQWVQTNKTTMAKTLTETGSHNHLASLITVVLQQMHILMEKTQMKSSESSSQSQLGNPALLYVVLLLAHGDLTENGMCTSKVGHDVIVISDTPLCQF